jgi:murein tripeptide amidase MpaA
LAPAVNIRKWATSLAVAAPMLLSLTLLAPAAVEARKTTEPAGFEYFHTYAENEQVIDDAVAAHPGIAKKFSIGQSYEGREIWGIKISDNVNSDESEPEVFLYGLTHARERASNEMALYLIQLLTDDYGSDSRIKAIVDSREIWIVPMLNPDGAEYDMSGGHWHLWRKNRQPIPDSTEIGVDLNRNWGYHWGGGSGHGTDGAINPASDYYRGWAPEVAPEVQDFEAFEDGRVVNGRQQIVASIGFHSAAHQVLWPYSYTKKDIPADMTVDDHAAFMALGQEAAALNGYKPQQGSDLYPVYGDQDDWAYDKYRIFGYTFEMKKGATHRYYPSQSELDADIDANVPAVLTFLENADCPYRVAGLDKDCGPLYDDFEIDRGWQVNASGSDDATSGKWEVGVPAKTRNSAGVKQRATTVSGMADLVTGAGSGGATQANDVDGGVTSVRSPAFTLGSGTGWKLDFSYTFAHNANASAADSLKVLVGGDVVFSQAGAPINRNAVWTPVSLDLDAYSGQTVRIVIQAADGGADSLVEAAIDDVRVYQGGNP